MADAEQPYKIETRTISGRGLIKWKPDKLHRRFWINCQVFRLPRHNFLSKKINPDRSEYAQITFMREGSVLREERLNFEFQTFVWEQDMTGYLSSQIQCWFEAIQGLLVGICTQLGIPTTDDIKIYANPIFDQFDSIKFVVRPDAAIRVDFWGLKYDLNCGSEEDPGSPPPPPPPNEPPVPPGTPVEVSPPYRYPDDSDDTEPLPEDTQPEPPPTGGACIKYNVTVSIVPIVGETFSQTFVLFGEFEGAGIGGDGRFVYVRCRGGESSLDPVAPNCLEELTDCAVFGSTDPAYSDAIITDIVEFG